MEFAVVAPLLFMLLLGIVEMGRMLMVQQILTNSAREGARVASMPGVTDAEVNEVIDDYLAANTISGHSRTVTPGAASASSGTPVTVTVSVPYRNVTWLPADVLMWSREAELSATVVMRKEER